MDRKTETQLRQELAQVWKMLEAERDALKSALSDAERYRWLKQQFRAMSLNMDGNHVWVQARSSALRGSDMDAACDAAMKA